MARPSYPGVLYFPLDCHLDDDIKLIQAEYGLIGFAIVVKLYQKIYGELGYYCEWNRDVGLLFSQNNGVGYNLVSEVVGACLRRGIFCEKLYDQYGILTSRGIQRRYLKMVDRRIGEKISLEYALVECAQKQEDNTETLETVTETPVSVCRNSPKVNKIKNTTTTTIACACAYEEPGAEDLDTGADREEYMKTVGTLGRGVVYLTSGQIEALLDRIGFDAFNFYVGKLADFIIEKNAYVKNHYKTILKWYKEDSKV